MSGDNQPKLSAVSLAGVQYSARNLNIPGGWSSARNIVDKQIGKPKTQKSNLYPKILEDDVPLGHRIDRQKSEDSVQKEAPAPHLKEFLSKMVNFNGNNLDPQLRKMCLICRAALEKPELLMIFEETLEFGAGIEKNLRTLFRLLEDTTILVITKTNSHLHLYKRVVLMDAGYLFSGGDLEQLIRNEQSFMFKYLHETDQRTLQSHLNHYGISLDFKQESNLAKTGGVSGFKQDDLSKVGGFSFPGRYRTHTSDSQVTDLRVVSRQLSNRDLSTRIIPGQQSAQEGGLSDKQLPAQSQSNILTNKFGETPSSTKLGLALREAFKISPFPAEEKNSMFGLSQKEIKVDPRGTIQSLSLFAPPADGPTLNKIATISSQGLLEIEEKSSMAPDKKHKPNSLVMPSSVDRELNLTDGVNQMNNRYNTLTHVNPKLLHNVGVPGDTQAKPLSTVSLDRFSLKVPEEKSQRSGILADGTEYESSAAKGVRVFPPTQSRGLAGKFGMKADPSLNANPRSQSHRPEYKQGFGAKPVYVVQEELVIKATRRLFVSKLE